MTARHALGQHFLLDSNITAKIARLAGPLTGCHVIEVGPGPGGLTRALLDEGAAQIVAIEIDPRAVAAIEALAAEPASAGRLTVRHADATRLDVTALVPAPRRLIANLPYNVATPLLIGWLRQAASFELLALMFQREVAERLVAAPATPCYGRLSVLAQWLCRVDLVLQLPPAAFVPAPAVSSALVRLVPHPIQPAPEAIIAMERATAAAFGQRRKMLRAALRPLGGETLLARAAIAGDRRGETLSITEFERLAAAL